ncbi:Fms-interacting protein-domain-containing protein [Syncephalastrum racemosum]|uniref:Fms-interacting protein-domain-containing protein n=1 Tax=Syncephalastrum racemosum TaxID=13706 RepID=A0A1X2H3P0_SYNRA|nr:Fms-interacting protein-domain-containing protein [Syncephalastrum racemosum]
MPTSTLVIQEAEAASKQLQSFLRQRLEQKAQGQELPGDNARQHLVLSDKLLDVQASAYNKTRENKKLTKEAKAVMDAKQLGLQNVMYEKRHLLEEIKKCRDFRSVYQDVELVSLDVFTQIAPEEYRQNMDDPHALMINRLKFELEQRRRLRERQEALQEERLALIRENRKAQEKLDKLDKHLYNFAQAAEPLEAALSKSASEAS